MGDAHAPAKAGDHGHDHGHGHGHDPNLAHHFETMGQQVEAGKLGMWLFLATEVLLFAGLFCAYAVYRANNPHIFLHGEQYLSKFWGGVNTIILLLSSFTVALAVRAASLGQQKNTVVFLALTIVGALGFLGVKAVEYRDKFSHGTLWGTRYHPHDDAPAEHAAPRAAAALLPERDAAVDYAVRTPWDQAATAQERSLIAVPPNVPAVKVTDARVAPEAAAEAAAATPQRLKDAHIFFGIYFVMTGLHGLHVIIGMIAIIWVMVRAAKGHFSASYYLPVDLVGLYWHLVDLVWIYLFPLLYLIG